MNAQSTATAAELRQQNHGQIKALMRNGELTKALQFIEKTVSELGPHIGLLCDMAACQYELGLFHSCTRTIQVIKNEYLQVADLLSEASSRKSALFLSKLLEEQGEILESLEFLQKARGYAKEENDIKVIASQELRILSWLGERKNLSEKYLHLTESLDQNDSLRIEIFHGLMWAEWCLFGFNHAQERFQHLLNLPLHLMDRRLMARDFLEMACLSQRQHEASALAAADLLKQNEPLAYDRFLILLQAGHGEALNAEHTDGCSVMMKLRVLILQMQIRQDENKVVELRKKIHFILETLSAPATQSLKKLIPSAQNELCNEILLNHQLKHAEINGDSIRLTPQQFLLLSSFLDSKAMNLEQVVKNLWNVDWDESYYHRIRMLVYKINETFQVHLGGPVFEIRKDGMTLANGVLIH